jgi:MFS family permease
VIGFAVATTGLGLSVVAFVSGLSIAPTLVASFSLVEELVEGSQLTEGLSWLTTGIVVGVAVSAPLAGRVVDAVGPHRAYLTAVAFAFLAAISVTLLQGRLTPGRTAWSPPTSAQGA